MGNLVVHNGLTLPYSSLPSGSGDDLLTVDPVTGVVGKISGTPLTTTLTAGYLFVGNVSNVATATAITGDVTINSSGVTAIGSGVIVNADVHANAAIATTKLAALTVDRATITNGSGFLAVSATTSTELGYVSGVTSAIQTQINGKQATITGAATTIVSLDLTASRALVSNGSGKVAVSAVTSTELGYLAGVSSAIQTQFSGKLSATITGAAQGDIIYYNGSAWVNLPRGTNGQALYSTATSIQWDTPTINGIPVGGTLNQVLAKQSGTDFDSDWETLTLDFIPSITATAAELNVLDGITATVTELNYTDGVTSAIQTQLDGKLSSALPQNALFVGNSSNIATTLAAGTNGYVLTSVSGVPTWAASSAGSPPGADTQVVFNDGGSFGADSAYTWDKTNNALTISNSRIFQIGSAGTSSFFAGSSAGNFTTTTIASVVIGDGAGAALTAAGDGNTFLGFNAGNDVTSGGLNTLVGYLSGDKITTGANNTGVGAESLGAVTTGSQNIGVGYNAGVNITTGSTNIIIGYSVNAQSATANGQLSIANAIFGSANTATGTTVSSGNLGFFATAWGGSAAKVIAVGTGTAPSGSNPADAFQMYSGDIVAGNAAAHFQTENGDVQKIYSIGGWGTPSGSLTRTTFDSGTVTLAQLAERVAALITDLKTGHQLLKA